jgi:3-oxoadipate enol-lactonase
VPFLERPDGCRLYLETHGDPTAPAILLLEGLGGDLPGWRRNIPALSRELFVVAYDHRGNGSSDEPPGPCSMGTFVDDAIAVLDDREVDRAHIYGQSFGGMVAQELALTHPERVRTLILAATHPGSRHAVPVDGAHVPKGEPWRALYAPGFPQAHPDHVAEDLRLGSQAPAHPMGQRRQWEAMQAWDRFAQLPSLRMPVLVIHGSEDLTVSPANAALLASRILGAELTVLRGAGHVYHSEQPEAADRAVMAFVRRHPDA